MDSPDSTALLQTLHAQVLHVFCDALDALEDERVSIAEGIELSQHLAWLILDFIRNVRPMGPTARATLVDQLRHAQLTFANEAP